MSVKWTLPWVIGVRLLTRADPESLSPLRHREMESVRALLDSPDHVQVAWGLYLVQKYRLVQFIPDLHRALAGADWKVRLLGIEGLIQLRSQVLPDELRGIATNFRESALVLAARHPAQFQDSLVTLLRGQLGSEEWLAVNNLLVKLKSPNVAGPLMQGLCLKIQVVLRDAGSNNIGFVLDGLACASAGGELRPDDYPPRYGYRLKSYGDQGDSLLAPGRRPVFVRRTLDWRFASVSIDRTAAGF